MEGLGAFTGSLALLLSALDQRAIVMEKTASSSGHRLVDMTSQEGDWFLEELCGLFGMFDIFLIFPALIVMSSETLE